MERSQMLSRTLVIDILGLLLYTIGIRCADQLYSMSCNWGEGLLM